MDIIQRRTTSDQLRPFIQIRIQRLSFSPPELLFLYLFNTIKTLMFHPILSPSNSLLANYYLDDWVYRWISCWRAGRADAPLQREAAHGADEATSQGHPHGLDSQHEIVGRSSFIKGLHEFTRW